MIIRPRCAAYAHIGIAEIDAHHAQIFRLLDRLEELIGSGPGDPGTMAAVGDLIEFADQHFFVEESLMRLFHYRDRDAHTADHERLRSELDDFRLGAFNSNVGGELLELLRFRLIDHIELMDRSYVAHFLGSGVAEAAATVP